MQKSTQELLHRLKEAKEADDIQKYLDDNTQEFIQETPESYLSGLMSMKRLKPADVARLSGQGDYVYKVFKGERKASRDILIAISIGMGLAIFEAQLLLRIAKAAQLDPRNRKDSVLIYALNNALTIEKTNEILYDSEEMTL